MCEHVMMLQILLLCVELMKIMENTHLYDLIPQSRVNHVIVVHRLW